ncbi:hypothetical protein HNO88_000303 [Novosphingobium chloroacetimidivorans]|uniref:Scaffolding protein n=1 Tax=Novosphingobium chloroacetimidivorans TaxID=1428314 RepID=A0A7W7K6D7_9SPHN|nr:hypothetical protein [Novosphingobium chloroacetimidivorans]MBB4857006.1 hypothetical protein [Novosphingobium chloroacetimidivorans]
MSAEDEPLDLSEELVIGDAPQFEGDDPAPEQDEQPEDVVIAFADDEDDESEPTPLVKRLREQIRERDRKLSQMRRSPAPANDADPEPQVPDRPRSVADYDYDEDQFNAAIDAHLAAKDEHAAWKQREEKRKSARGEQEAEQARQIEQQRKALGVGDYEVKAAAVRDRLSDAQMAILINGADNPAQMIYALGRSESRLDMLCGEENLAKFAVMLGKMEKDIKVTKKTAPTPESRVRGASGPMNIGGDKQLEKLEKEAARTGDRTKLIQYRQTLKTRAA